MQCTSHFICHSKFPNSFLKRQLPEKRLESNIVLENDDFGVVVDDDVLPDVVVAHEAADLTHGDRPAVIRFLEFGHHLNAVTIQVFLVDILKVNKI